MLVILIFVGLRALMEVKLQTFRYALMCSGVNLKMSFSEVKFVNTKQLRSWMFLNFAMMKFSLFYIKKHKTMGEREDFCARSDYL